MKIHNIIKCKRGEATLGLMIVAPFLVYFLLYLIFLALFFLRINEMKTITNKMLDRAVVEGQFTIVLQAELKENLINAGFEEENLEINITPNASADISDFTYTKRGDEIQIIVIYKKPHNLYFLSFGAGGEKAYYISTKASGMSEKW